MKTHVKIIPFLVASVGSYLVMGNQPTNPKNIILFLVDDMGWQDTSHPFWTDTTVFNKIYHTPNMEKLAAKGITFTHAYASAVSSPTRTSLMTGMNPAAHKVTNWTVLKDKPTDNKKDLTIELPEWNYNGLQPLGTNINNTVEALTLPQVLQQQGYFTIHCGKAHWGVKNTPGANPLNLGFNVNIAGYEGGAPASYLASENFGFNENGQSTNKFSVPGLEKYWGTDLFLTEILTLEAQKAMDSIIDCKKPFYLYLSHYAIHTPLDKDDRYYQKYREAGLDDSQARYAGLIEGMDKSLGDIMKYLDKKGVAENTVILFMSDNGGLSQHARSGIQDQHNFPLNNGKGSAYEGGVRVPMIVYYPNVTKKASRCNVPVSISDFFPTITEISSIKSVKTPQKIDGISFVPLLSCPKKTPKQFERSLVFHFPNRWIHYGNPKGKGYGTYSSIIKEEWKLIYYYDFNFCELYNLNADIGETKDLSNQPSTVKIQKTLTKELTAALKKHKAQLPKFKNGNWCTYPDGSHYQP